MNENMNEEYAEALEQAAVEALEKLDAAIDVDYLTANGQLQMADDICNKMVELINNGKWKSKRFEFGI